MNVQSSVRLRTGSQMPIIGLGTWQLKDNAAEHIAYALHIGYTMIDTAGNYGTQPEIAEGITLSGLSRQQYYLVTKIENDENAFEAAKHNISELGVERVDLVLIHWPPDNGAGEDLWQGLIDARAAGLTTDIGVSNYSVAQLRELVDKTHEKPAVNQIEWSPFGYDREMFEYCADNGIVIQAYSPLTRGKKLQNEIIQELADIHGKTPAQILLRWNIETGIVPIVKSGNKQHLKENLDIFDFSLTDDELQKLHTLNRHYSALGGMPAYVSP